MMIVRTVKFQTKESDDIAASSRHPVRTIIAELGGNKGGEGGSNREHPSNASPERHDEHRCLLRQPQFFTIVKRKQKLQTFSTQRGGSSSLQDAGLKKGEQKRGSSGQYPF
jgi:hypothetical protein